MEFVKVIYTKNIARIILNNPKKVNALSINMISKISKTLDNIRNNNNIKVVLISSVGEHFCAGHLLDEMIGKSIESYYEIFENCSIMMQKIRKLPQPVITSVQGIATAAGCQLVTASDITIASDTACFATPGIRIGLFCTTPAVPLVRVIGQRRAIEMLLTGRIISSREALQWGLINKVVSCNNLSDETEKIIHQIVDNTSSVALMLGKKAFYDQLTMNESEAYRIAVTTMTLNIMTDDAQNGIKCFIKKEKPKFLNK